MTLKQLAKMISDDRGYSVPEHARLIRPLSDKNANELTKSILAYFKFKNIKAWRQASEGRYIKGNDYTDWMGRKKEEKGIYIPRANAGLGAGDICAVMPPLGRMLSIEVKHGKDYQKPDQKIFQVEVEASGGLYMIVKTWDDFWVQINKIK